MYRTSPLLVFSALVLTLVETEVRRTRGWFRPLAFIKIRNGGIERYDLAAMARAVGGSGRADMAAAAAHFLTDHDDVTQIGVAQRIDGCDEGPPWRGPLSVGAEYVEVACAGRNQASWSICAPVIRRGGIVRLGPWESFQVGPTGILGDALELVQAAEDAEGLRKPA